MSLNSINTKNIKTQHVIDGGKATKSSIKMKVQRIHHKIQKNVNKSPYTFSIKKRVNHEHLLDNPSELLAYTKEFSPLSGSEHPYEPEKWNDRESIRTTHNCYSYALGKIRHKLKSKAQPGYASGHNYIDDVKDYNCKSFYKRVKKDNPYAYLEKFDNPCDKGFYKVFLALDVGNDYHWWRQNGAKKGNNSENPTSGYWSHKPGSTDVTDVDASGKKIKNPILADRKYSSLNYSTPCFFMCVHKDLSQSMSVVYKGSKKSNNNDLGIF
jgi:hypothetical protein